MTAAAAKVPPIAAALLLLTVLVPASAKPGPPPPVITVLQIGPGARYARIAAAVAAANADKDPRKTYVVEVASGTYANDFVEVTRPMTIAAAGPDRSCSTPRRRSQTRRGSSMRPPI